MNRTYPRARVRYLTGPRHWIIDIHTTAKGKTRLVGYSFKELPKAWDKAALVVDNRRRGVHPKGRTPTLATRPTHCPDCGRPVRLNTDKAAEHPGTVCMFSSSTGLCGRCHRARTGFTSTQRPVRVTPVTRPADEPTTVPMTEAEVREAMPVPRSPRPAPPRPVPAPVVTEQVREATEVLLGPHYLKPDADGEPFCACGWDPYLEADFCDDKSAAVTAVRIHLRKVRTVS